MPRLKNNRKRLPKTGQKQTNVLTTDQSRKGEMMAPLVLHSAY